MALVEMLMPKMGESIMEGTILKWLKNVGDPIEQDESVLEVATDKVDTEVPAIHGGVLQEILAQEGEVVPVGQAIARINTGGAEELTQASETEEAPTAQADATSSPDQSEEQPQTADSEESPWLSERALGRFYSPLVLNIARQEDISLQELEYVPGSGKEGRVAKKDILTYVSRRSEAGQMPRPWDQQSTGEQAAQVAATTGGRPAAPAQQKANLSTPTSATTPTHSFSGESEILEMDRMRKMIAQRMVDSKRISAHVTSYVEADVTNIVHWRNQVKGSYQQREGENLTYTPLFVEAVAKAIKDFPLINVSVDGDRIIRKKDINIGIAVALPSGNLIVPVIRNADRLNLNGLSKKVNDLATRARNNKLTPDDLAEATYTLTNVGTFGNVMGTPIIMQPQVAILAVGVIKKKPAVIETPDGDLIGIRQFMFLSHSYDHRVIDGSLGGQFVRRVADYLEGFDPNTKV